MRSHTRKDEKTKRECVESEKFTNEVKLHLKKLLKSNERSKMCWYNENANNKAAKGRPWS